MKSWRRVLVILSTILSVWLVWLLLAFQITIETDNERPTLLAGDRVMVNRLSYGFRLPFERLLGYHKMGSSLPQRFDFMAFNDPLEQNKHVSEKDMCIGQCTALPGDTIWLEWTPPKDTSNVDTKTKKYPFVVPRKGVPVEVTPWNATLLSNTLYLHENKNVCRDCSNGMLVVNGTPQQDVVFSQDYVWIGKQKGHTIYDSHFFGLLPASHIIGRLSFVTISKNPTKSFLTGFRHSRFFRSIYRGNYKQAPKTPLESK